MDEITVIYKRTSTDLRIVERQGVPSWPRLICRISPVSDILIQLITASAEVSASYWVQSSLAPALAEANNRCLKTY